MYLKATIIVATNFSDWHTIVHSRSGVADICYHNFVILCRIYAQQSVLYSPSRADSAGMH